MSREGERMPAGQWDSLASLPGLRAVLDPADVTGAKNAVVDRAHKLALSRELRDIRGPVLDFGCGNGRLSRWLTDKGYDVLGVDTSEAMIDAARRNVPEVPFRVSEGVSIPCEADMFAAVVSVGVLLYVVGTAAYPAVLRELARVLRPHGRLIAIEQLGDRGELGRGGQLEEYTRGLTDTGWVVSRVSPMRRNDLRSLAEAMRRPRLAQLPGYARLMALETRLRPKPLIGSRYAEYLLAAHR